MSDCSTVSGGLRGDLMASIPVKLPVVMCTCHNIIICADPVDFYRFPPPYLRRNRNCSSPRHNRAVAQSPATRDTHPSASSLRTRAADIALSSSTHSVRPSFSHQLYINTALCALERASGPPSIRWQSTGRDIIKSFRQLRYNERGQRAAAAAGGVQRVRAGIRLAVPRVTRARARPQARRRGQPQQELPLCPPVTRVGRFALFRLKCLHFRDGICIIAVYPCTDANSRSPPVLPPVP